MELNYYQYILDMTKTLSKPKVVIFELTHLCNLKCGHCYNDRLFELNELNTEEVIKILKTIPSPTTTVLGFTGGEVMMRSDFIEILKSADKIGFENINIDSNGTLINEKVICILKELGVNTLHISLDGPENINDKLRGKGTYQKIVNAIKLAVREGMTVTANMTVGKLNAECIEKLFSLLEPLKIHYFKVEPLLIKSNINNWKELLLVKADILKICNSLKKLSNSSRPVLIIDNLFKTYMEEKPLLGCPSAKTFCMISKNGRMFHCPVFTEYASLEDCLLSHDFKEVWRKSKFLNALRDPESYEKACHGCHHLEICAGGCHARSFIETGSFFERDPLCPF